MSTLDYYNQNADAYVESTIHADMSDAYDRFEKLLPAGAKVLDLGCGSGRDSKHFLEKGYSVSAVDGSNELCKLASQITGIPVRCMRFEELSYSEEFNGIWACASLLHAEKAKMQDILGKINQALKPGGVLYVSYKYGESEREENGKHYSDYTENNIESLLKDSGLSLDGFWISGDKLKRLNQWLNILARKD